MGWYESPTGSCPDAFDLLQDEHRRIEDLFEQFDGETNQRVRDRIAAQALEELTVHAAIEEELFYPAVREAHPDEVTTEMMNKALEEHYLAKILIAELESMGPADQAFEAKFQVLAETVGHHMREEEAEVFPKAKEADTTNWVRLGDRMRGRRQELIQHAPGSGPVEGHSDCRSSVRTANRRGSRTGRRSSAQRISTKRK